MAGKQGEAKGMRYVREILRLNIICGIKPHGIGQQLKISHNTITGDTQNCFLTYFNICPSIPLSPYKFLLRNSVCHGLFSRIIYIFDIHLLGTKTV